MLSISNDTRVLAKSLKLVQYATDLHQTHLRKSPSQHPADLTDVIQPAHINEGNLCDLSRQRISTTEGHISGSPLFISLSEQEERFSVVTVFPLCSQAAKP